MNDKAKISESDNEAAGRLLMMGAFLILGACFLLVSPILIGGFLIGLTWYGAYMEDEERNGEKLIWPIFLTVTIFSYLLGFVPPLNRFYEGVLFTDFFKWTESQIGSVLEAINACLPRKLEIRSVTINQVRFYVWAMIPIAAGTLGYLHIKGAGRGVFLYRGMKTCFSPFRMAAEYWQYVLGVAVTTMAINLTIGLPHWLYVGIICSTLLLWFYFLTANGWESKGSASEARATNVGPIHIGRDKGTGKTITLSEDQLNHHVHIVGASGFGKSVLLSHVIKNRILSGSGLMFVDLKADFETIRQVVSTAKSAKRMEDLFIFSCGNPEISKNYNVVGRGTANQLKDRIMGALNWSEEFYKNEASSFLLKLLRGLTAIRDQSGDSFDLGTILKCIENPGEIRLMLEQIDPSMTEMRSQLESLITHLSRLENVKALQGLKSQLESLLYSDFGHLLQANPSGLDLFEAIRSKKIVYVLLDSRTYGESARALGKLILQDLKAASARIDAEIPRSDRTPFSVIIDEFADMATEDFIGFLDRARSSKIGVVVAHQEISDLTRVSPEFTRRLMNSTSTLFAFLQKLPDSSELIAGISGTRKTKEVTEQAKTNWLFGDEKTGMKSIKEVDEFVIHPNIIRSLSVGECVMVQKYPKSIASVVKVRTETKDYLGHEEVAEELRKVTPIIPRQVRNKTVTHKHSGREVQVDKAYWNNENQI